jgi:hypothetical protein
MSAEHLSARPEWFRALADAKDAAAVAGSRISPEAWQQLGRVVDSTPYPRPLRGAFLAALAVALQGEIDARANMAAELREAAEALGDGPVSERLVARADALDAGVTLTELAAAGDSTAAFVLEHERKVASAALDLPHSEAADDDGLSSGWRAFAGAVLVAAVLLLLFSCGGYELPRSIQHAQAAPAPSTPVVRALPVNFVAPESCARMSDGWVVSEQGCGYEQPCREAHGPHGRLVLVRDDGSREDLITALIEPKGVDVDAAGNLWVAHKDGLVVRTAAGAEVRVAVSGAKLLNDVAAAPHFVSAVWVSDSVTGIIHLAQVRGEQIEMAPYAQLPDAPNGLAPALDSDGVSVTTLGDLELPGKPGRLVTVDPAADARHGAAVRPGNGPGGFKLDGVVALDGAYLVSGIFDVGANKLSASLWRVPLSGRASMLFDGAAFGLVSAADIGRDSKTGDICIPDLNGSQGMTQDFAAGAKVLIVSGIR